MSTIQGVGGQRYVAPQTNKTQSSARQTSARATADYYVSGGSSAVQTETKIKPFTSAMASELAGKYDVQNMSRNQYTKLLAELRDSGVLTPQEYSAAYGGTMPTDDQSVYWPHGSEAVDFSQLLRDCEASCADYTTNTAQTDSEKANGEMLTAAYSKLGGILEQISQAQTEGPANPQEASETEVQPSLSVRMTHQNGVALSPDEGQRRMEETAAKYQTRQTNMLYEENENGVKVPKNFVMMAEMQEGKNYSTEISQAFAQYHSGEVDATSVKNTLSATVASLRNYYIEQGYSEDDIMPGLIEDVYSQAKLYNVHGAFESSWQDSLPLAAEQNGHDGNTRDWIYYDSKYYYSVEEMATSIQDMMREIGAEYGITDFDLPMEYEDGDIRKGIYSSYNTIISHNASNDAHVGNMIDETLAPPEGFRFFYKGNQDGMNLLAPTITDVTGEPEAAFDGVLQAWYGDWSFTGRVPVRQNPDKFPISVNMFDVINNADPSGAPSEITSFLKNFDFFAPFMSGLYAKENPR